jgi:hypothetical protein
VGGLEFDHTFPAAVVGLECICCRNTARSPQFHHQLDVVLFGGWDSTVGQAVKECTLLQQRLVVLETKEFNSLWVLLISACVFGFLIGLVIIVVKRKSK